MSGASTSQNTSTTKATIPTDTNNAPAPPPARPSTQLEEDDEFEDFPVEDWGDEETDLGAATGPSKLWEESWDDDDTSEDFAQMLKEELKKVEASKR